MRGRNAHEPTLKNDPSPAQGKLVGYPQNKKQIPRAAALGMTVLGVKATEGFLRALVRDGKNARFATHTKNAGLKPGAT